MSKKKVGVIIIAVAIAMVISGCAAGRTVVIRPVQVINRVQINSVEVKNVKSTVDVGDDILGKIRYKLIEKLQKTEAFPEVKMEGLGKGIIIESELVQYDKGSRFDRWFWGGIGNAGEGSLMIKAVYKDKVSQEILAEIQTEGRINSGFYGGDFDLAFGKALDEIVKYTVKHFGHEEEESGVKK